MPRFVVLLRDVNVGKANLVPMAEFRGMLEALGHSDVKTLVNSGNAVFTSTRSSADKLADEIGAGLAERFGVATPVIVKSASELQAKAGKGVTTRNWGTTLKLFSLTDTARR